MIRWELDPYAGDSVERWFALFTIPGPPERNLHVDVDAHGWALFQLISDPAGRTPAMHTTSGGKGKPTRTAPAERTPFQACQLLADLADDGWITRGRRNFHYSRQIQHIGVGGMTPAEVERAEWPVHFHWHATQKTNVFSAWRAIRKDLTFIEAWDQWPGIHPSKVRR